MENNKEVKDIAEHKEQHHAEAPPPQEYHPNRADNPLQPPQSQQLPPACGAMEGKEGESNVIPETEEDDCCCCGPRCVYRVIMEDHDECCCTVLCVLMCVFIVLCVGNGCRDSFY
ncbi:unnamed protein product [Eruca vesicaria subsp. sativa]|uniref:Uncharacterized protein n=1 Tax=Eruca vesicaria subsp. sativa TaxID=29727 RepID=A0ABC8KA17_ERUVS|nr:unnamed protein product [Eruca vesicaria subsp. sativa]